jgi:hypothetical protein
MFSIQYIKVPPTNYLLQYRRGKLVREGTGLSFFYFAPATSLVMVPMASVDAPFIFNEVSADFQTITIQGQITYRVAEPRKTAELLDFTLDNRGRGYASDDLNKLPLRVVNVVQVLMRAELQGLDLNAALRASDRLVQAVLKGLGQSREIASLGLEILGLAILAIKPTPETARALEAQAREQLLREADEAIYARRNAAVEQERAIKENELNTEIAIETKRRQIRETQMDAERAVQEKRRLLQQEDMNGRIALEEKNTSLVKLAADNARSEADAKAYGIAAAMKAFASVDPKILQALGAVGMDPGQLVALAFRDLAENATKIGELNVSPELLRQLIDKKTT